MGTVNAVLLPTSSGISLHDAWQLSVLKLIFFYFVELDIVFFFFPPVVIAGICHESEEQGFFYQCDAKN